jgi:hypothetical protein
MDGLICLRALWDRIAAWAFIIGGGLLVLDAGQHARDAVFAANSFSFLTSGGIGGLAAVTVGCTLLVSAGFHDEWRKLDRIEATLAPSPVTAATGDPTGPGRWLRAEADRTAGWALVLAAGVWLAVGSRLVADALYAPKQVTYVISGGLAAFVVLLLGLAALLAADTRDEEDKLHRIDALLPPPVAVNGDDNGRSRPRGRRAPVAAAALVLVTGGACLAAGWWTAADALLVDRALDGLVWAVIGASLVAAMLMAATARRRRRLVLQARQVLGRMAREHAVGRPAEVHRNGAGFTRWTAEGLQHIHLAACPVMAGIDTARRTPVPVGSALEPCLLCDDEEVTADA